MELSDRLCGTPAERAALERVRTASNDVFERHSLRVFLIAEELGARDGVDFDREVLLVAALLHDIGLYRRPQPGSTYVVEGRIDGDEIGREQDWAQERIALLCDAIERHHEVRAQWDRGTEVELIRRADFADAVPLGWRRFGLEAGWIGALHARVPKRGMYPAIVALLKSQPPASLLRIFVRP